LKTLEVLPYLCVQRERHYFVQTQFAFPHNTSLTRSGSVFLENTRGIALFVRTKGNASYLYRQKGIGFPPIPSLFSRCVQKISLQKPFGFFAQGYFSFVF